MIAWLLLLLVVVPCARAASPVGLMTVSGPVRIGGSEFQAKAVSSWPVVAGDEIVTAKQSRAVLVSPTAGRLEIRSDSRVTANEEAVVLHEGEVGAERFVVQVGEYTVRPKADAKGRSWFVVSTRNGAPVFSAHQGDLWVSQGDPNPVLVRAGTYAIPSAPPQASSGAAPSATPQVEVRPDQSAALPGASAAASAATTGWTVGALSHASSAALLSGVSAAATAGTVTGVTLIEPSKSLPQRSPSYSK